MNGTRHIITVIAAMFMLAACGGGGAGHIEPPEIQPILTTKDLKLRQLGNSDLLERFRARAIKRIEQETFCYDEQVVFDTPVIAAAPMADAAGESSADDFTFTDTNNQESGIHEGDLVKVRGDHAFILQKDQQGNAMLRVVQVWPFANFGEVAKVNVGAIDSNGYYGRPMSLLATDTRVAVLRYIYDTDWQPAYCPYTCCLWVPPRYTTVTIYDVSDPTAPTLVSETDYQGELVASRRIGNKAILVLNSSMHHPKPAQPLNPWASDCETRVGQVRAELREAIAKFELKDFLPKVVRTKGVRNGVITPQRFYGNGESGSSLLMVAHVDLGGTQLEQISVAYGNAMEVYASRGKIYSTQASWVTSEDPNTSSSNFYATAIHAFNITGAAPEFQGTGVVRGRLINQFAMGEHQGVLRVATSANGNSVYTLDAESPDLPVIGGVEELARGEQIFAVRFIGKMAYVVTFLQVDPLFVIDMSDPTAPKVAGELKIPGFSNYLHPIDDGHLIGVGREGSVKLSLFDVTNPENPLETDTHLLDAFNSQAQFDHHAFTFDPERELLAIPVGWYSDQEVHLLNTSVQAGFTEIGTVPATGEHVRSVILGDNVTTGLLIVRDQDVELYDVGAGLTSLGKVQ